MHHDKDDAGQELLTIEVSDEAIEAAAGNSDGPSPSALCPTLVFCS